MRSILIITPYDRESLMIFLSQFKEAIKEFPIEVQSPALFADYIYRNMDDQNPYSFFTCFLAGIDAYRNLAAKDEVFMLNAPLRFMIGTSPKDIKYDEVWLYRENISTTHEEVLSYYKSKAKGDLDQYLNIYEAEEATRKFNTFQGLVAAVSKELSKEIRGYGDV
jgi:chromosome condensin MukBEF complex kleisin-like MukF subunit